MASQHTIGRLVEIEGVGLHTGKPCRVRLKPAAAGSGLNFLCEGITIPARPEFVVSTERATVLGKEGCKISTVEHILSTFYGLGIENVSIEVEGPEIPILDGSAAVFVEKIRGAGMKRLLRPAPSLCLQVPVWAAEEDSLILALPCPTLRVTYMGGFPGMELRETSMMIYAKAFAENIAPARTFVSREEIESLRARGLGQGGSEENVVVLEEKGASAPLRFPDEPLRHKILDIVGDLALLGKGLFAHIIAIRSGHKLNLQLVNKILEAAT